jgi:hypothetical protein
MCDYSLHQVRNRPGRVGDKLTTRDFGQGTHGFAESGDTNLAICLLPGTELTFAKEVTQCETLCPWSSKIKHKTAIVSRVNKEWFRTHHDALEFPDGRGVLLTLLAAGQKATILQLPASPKPPERTEGPAIEHFQNLETVECLTL